MPPAPKPAPAGEQSVPATPEDGKAKERADTFARVGAVRTVKALDAIDAIASLTQNKQRYAWTPEQAAKIADALDSKVNDLRERFAGHVTAPGGFEL